jgi:hypothetical protein
VIAVVWGDIYRNYLLEYALPTLLAPGNIPALKGRRPVKYLVASTPEDWSIIRDTAIFRELTKYAEPVFLELPPKGDSPYWVYAITGHKLCCEMAARDKAYRILTSPDALYSDGTLARLHEIVLNGAEVVLKLVTPLTRTEPFFARFAELGFQPKESARDTGIPITISPRQIVTLAMRAMHGMSGIQEWEAPYFSRYASTPWWQVPGTEGAVITGNFWDLFLVDYGAVQHDGSLLETRGFDGDYIMRTITHLETIYFVRDSDELHIVSWASMPEPPARRHHGGEFLKGAAFRVSANNPVFNGFQRATLFLPSLVHSGELNRDWDAVEAKALRTIATWIDPPTDIERYSRALQPHRRNYAGLQAKIDACRLPWWRENALTWGVVRLVVVPAVKQWVRTREFFTNISHARNRIMLALRGDKASIEKLRWHGRRLLAKALGRSPG